MTGDTRGKPVPPVRGRLLAVLGLAFGLAVTVGNTIASGILRTPGEVAGHLRSPVLFMGVWLLGALYALLGGNALAELAALTKKSGGYTVFAHRALGPFAGFAAGWSDWLATCTSLAAAAFVVAEAATALGAPGSTRAVAATVVVGVALLQLRGVRSASRAQEVTTLLKALAFAALIIACFMAPAGSRHALPAAPPAVPLAIGFVLAMQSVIFTYDGYYGVVYFAGEVKDPGRDIPRSMFGGIAAIAAIYILLNAAFLHVLTIDGMAGRELVAADAAGVLFGPRTETGIRLLIIISLLSSINAFQLMASRTLYAIGESGIFPAGARVNAGGTPTIALALSTAAALFFVLSGSFGKVLAVTAFFFVANYTLAFVSMFVLRWREPDAPRPFRARGHPWTTGVVLVGSLAFVAGALWTDTLNSLIALALLALSYPLFRALNR